MDDPISQLLSLFGSLCLVFSSISLMWLIFSPRSVVEMHDVMEEWGYVKTSVVMIALSVNHANEQAMWAWGIAGLSSLLHIEIVNRTKNRRK